MKENKKGAGQRRCQRLSAPTISHDSPAVLLVPTGADCCPSAARRPTHAWCRTPPDGPARLFGRGSSAVLAFDPISPQRGLPKPDGMTSCSEISALQVEREAPY